jgi:predicted anti-sigma-YlaC factor YlaD
MATNEMTEEELLALFRDKANTPPSGPNELLARHLKCKQSRDLSEAVARAATRYIDTANPRLLPPSEMLPPLA